MSRRSWQTPGGSVRKALVALLCVTGCLAAGAFAAGAHLAAGRGPATEPGASVISDGLGHRAALHRRGRRLRKPRIVHHPARTSLQRTVVFRVRNRARHARLRCRLDRRRWKRCRKRVRYGHLAIGRHRFRVRAVGRRGARSRVRAYRWRVVAPVRFSIEARPAAIGPLYPGASPSPIPLVVSNPNPAPIFVTSLTVQATAGPPGCDPATNLRLIPSSASEFAPLRVPAKRSVRLPRGAVSMPAVGLLELPVNQDACKGGEFSLIFHGSAHG